MKQSSIELPTGYEPFENFVFRVPVFNTTKPFEDPALLKDPIFKEALYLASKALYERMKLQEDAPFDALPDKMKKSLFKYFSRMTTRCTPFGLFAGCGLGTIGDDSSILLPSQDGYRSKSTISILLLHHIATRINNNYGFQAPVLYYPNTSLFRAHTTYRYVEATMKEEVFDYVMSEVPVSSYLDRILTMASPGITRSALALMLEQEEEVEYEDAQAFIEELVKNQVLVSEFSIHITNEDNLNLFISRMKQIEGCTDPLLLPLLQEISELLNRVDNAPQGEKLPHLELLDGIIAERLGFQSEQEFIRTNLFVQATHATLSKTLVDKVKKGIHVLNLFSPPAEHHLLRDFKEKFYRRYEHEEVPLVEALDPDIGVSLGNYSPSGIGVVSLLSGIFPSTDTIRGCNNNIGIPVALNSFILQKYQHYIKQREDAIYITEQELQGLEPRWDDIPATISVGIDVLTTKDTQTPAVLIKYAGGMSGVNTTSRFSNLDESFRQYTKDIIAFEESCFPADTIIADIAYTVQDPGLANVMQRPGLRKYEIPLLSLPSGDAVAVPIKDIMVSLTEDHQLRLRSRSLNKYIIPRNSTAHNFTMKTTPMYHFLSAYQGEGNLRGALIFNWGDLAPENGYFPRIVFEKDIVLCAARWKIQAWEINAGKDFTTQMKALIEARNIPNRVYLTSGNENKLLLDLQREEVFALLKSEMKKGEIQLEEYLMDEAAPLIMGNGGYYNHEIILNFYKR